MLFDHIGVYQPVNQYYVPIYYQYSNQSAIACNMQFAATNLIRNMIIMVTYIFNFSPTLHAHGCKLVCMGFTLASTIIGNDKLCT